MATRNYQYGARTPVIDGRDGTPELLRILDLANKYRNRLVDIELDKRSRTVARLRELSLEWAAALDRCEECEQAVEAELARTKAERQRTREMVAFDAAKLAELRTALAEARAAEKTLKKAAYRDHADAVDEIKKERYNAIKTAYKEASDLYWGTKGLIHQAAEEFSRGAPPKYQRFTGEGRLGNQLIKGLSVEALHCANDTQLRLVDRETGGRRKMLWFRIDSTEKRKPIWCQVPVIWHRDLPVGARIKWCALQRHIVGKTVTWSVLITIDIVDATPANLATRGACGIDINYRVTPAGGQRVAVAYGDDGMLHELRLPPGLVAQWQKTRDLRGIRDDAFNAIKETLRAWSDGRELPEWLDLSTLSAWRSAQRLSRLVYEWYRERQPVPGEEEILPALIEWRDREEHLYLYESHLREQLMANRKNLYRAWVADLRSRYRTVYLEKMDLRSAIHDTLRPEEEQEVLSEQRAAASFVCLSSLREIVKHSGMVNVFVRPECTTLACHACGQITAIDAAVQVRYTCEHCGVEWDQDVNAARNILARGQVGAESQEPLATDGGAGLTPTGKPKKRISRSERYAAARKKRSEEKRRKELE